VNNRIRQQLRELRIDPDTTVGVDLEADQADTTGARGFVSRHKLMIVVATTTCTLSALVVMALVLIAHSYTTTTQANQSSEPIVSHMAFAGLQLDIAPPRYQSISTDGTTPSLQWVLVTMNVGNVSDGVVSIEAGDLNLVDSHGALFAPLWREPGGGLSDGFAAPKHTIFALAPGGTAEVTLVFTIRETGRYLLRYLGPRADSVSEIPLVIR
jgi:hypothetical protein